MPGIATAADRAEKYIIDGSPSEKTIAAKFTETETLIQNVANGVNRGYSFDSIDKLIGDLEGQANNTKYKIGDELYIKSTDKPDYWVAEVVTTKGAAVTSISDGATVGYWVLYKLGEKTDLTLYQTKTDSGLVTSDKTVVGAVNEVKENAGIAYSLASNCSKRFDKMGYNEIILPSGATVHLSETAVRAAESDGLGNTIAETYVKSVGISNGTNELRVEKGNKISTFIPLPDWTYTGTSPIIVTDKVIGIKKAEANMPGVIQIGYSPNGKNYPVVLDDVGRAYVNVPWTDTIYTLPAATTTVRGGVKVGAVRSAAVTTNAASSEAGRYYAVERDSAEKLFVNIPWQNTTYGLATQSANGLMSAADKTKLDHIGISVTGEEMTITLS